MYSQIAYTHLSSIPSLSPLYPFYQVDLPVAFPAAGWQLQYTNEGFVQKMSQENKTGTSSRNWEWCQGSPYKCDVDSTSKRYKMALKWHDGPCNKVNTTLRNEKKTSNERWGINTPFVLENHSGNDWLHCPEFRSRPQLEMSHGPRKMGFVND
jgi:hypothetical protein